MNGAKCIARRGRDREKQNTQSKSTQGEDVRASRTEQVAWTRFLFCFSRPKDFIIYLGLTQLQGEHCELLHRRFCMARGWEQSSERRWAPKAKENLKSMFPFWVNTQTNQLVCQQHFWVKVISADSFLQPELTALSSKPQKSHIGLTTALRGGYTPNSGPEPSQLFSYL